MADSSAEISFISKHDLNAGGIKMAEKFTSDRPDYQTRVKELKSYINGHGWDQNTNVTSGELYNVINFNDNRIETIRMEERTGLNNYIIKLTSTKKGVRYFFLKYGQPSKLLPGNPHAFAFILKTISGETIASSSLDDVVKNRVSVTWWGGVQDEYNKLCGTSIWAAIACNAGTVVCPECGLVILLAWMIYCADIV